MKILITTPDHSIFESEAYLIQLQGLDGKFEIMEHHAPLIAVIDKGRARILDLEKKEIYLDLETGILQVRDNEVIILTE